MANVKCKTGDNCRERLKERGISLHNMAEDGISFKLSSPSILCKDEIFGDIHEYEPNGIRY